MGLPRHPLHGPHPRIRHRRTPQTGRRHRARLVAVTGAHLPLDRQARRARVCPPVAEEPGIAGGNRTILAATRTGRAQLRKWLATPVSHLRDLRSELLLKLIIAEKCEVDITAMLREQHLVIAHLADTIAAELEQRPGDVVALCAASRRPPRSASSTDSRTSAREHEEQSRDTRP